MNSLNYSQSSLSYAESLYQENDFYNAATEYERYLFYNKAALNDSIQNDTRLKLADCYFHSRESDKAIKMLQVLMQEQGRYARQAQFQLAKHYLSEKEFFKAEIELNDLLLFNNEPQLLQQPVSAKEIYNTLGYIALQQKDLDNATYYFHATQDSYLIKNTQRMLKLPKKNLLLAQVFSSIIPGSGEIYCGRYGWGILSFVVNSASILSTIHCYKNKQYLDAALIFSLLFTRFYNGSRNNAKAFAQEFNDHIYDRNLVDIENYFNR